MLVPGLGMVAITVCPPPSVRDISAGLGDNSSISLRFANMVSGIKDSVAAAVGMATRSQKDALLGIATDIAAKEVNGEMEVAIGNMLESSLDNALLDAADHSAKGVVKGFKEASRISLSRPSTGHAAAPAAAPPASSGVPPGSPAQAVASPLPASTAHAAASCSASTGAPPSGPVQAETAPAPAPSPAVPAAAPVACGSEAASPSPVAASSLSVGASASAPSSRTPSVLLSPSGGTGAAFSTPAAGTSLDQAHSNPRKSYASAASNGPQTGEKRAESPTAGNSTGAKKKKNGRGRGQK